MFVLHRWKIVLLFVSIGLGGIYLSSDRLPGEDFNIITTSPQGTYHVKLEGKAKPSNALQGEFYVQEVKIEALKESQVIFADNNFYRADPYETSFLQAYPTYEWLNDYTLRLGESSTQPFYDEIIISNDTEEQLYFLILRYGKYERFLIFDLTSKQKVQLKASPQLRKEHPATMVTYNAYTNGHSFSGSAGELKQRTVVNGALRILVEIKKPKQQL